MRATDIRQDLPAVLDVEYIELYVSNLYQAAHFLRSVLGFEIVANPKRSNSSDTEASVCARGQRIRLILTAPLRSTSLVAEHIRHYGEGIKDIALSVTGLDRLFTTATDSGWLPVFPPTTGDVNGQSSRTAAIGNKGVVIHTLVEQQTATSTLSSTSSGSYGLRTGLERIDHVALAVGFGDLENSVSLYVNGLGFSETHQEDVSTEYSGMRSKVVQSRNGRVRFPIMEPASGLRKSQIAEFLEYHEGEGVQHLAFECSDIIKTVSATMAAGLEFLTTPRAYYDTLPKGVEMHHELETLAQLGILADRDSAGTLFQIFTKPVVSRPTLFFEIVERRGAEGFGAGNIKALFEAVERRRALGGST